MYNTKCVRSLRTLAAQVLSDHRMSIPDNIVTCEVLGCEVYVHQPHVVNNGIYHALVWYCVCCDTMMHIDLVFVISINITNYCICKHCVPWGLPLDTLAAKTGSMSLAGRMVGHPMEPISYKILGFRGDSCIMIAQFNMHVNTVLLVTRSENC